MNNIPDYSERKIWIWSDAHFSHRNIIRYCDRPFADEKIMNQTLFNNCVNTVGENDILFHLGDFVSGAGQLKVEVAQEIDSNLPGEKYYICGNHDRKDFIPNRMILNSPDQIWCFRYNGLDIGLSHFPQKEFDSDILLYGHVHNRSVDEFNTFNCSVENIGYKPILLDDIIKILIERTEKE